ncbi:MAG: Holliday junction resolvase RuvX, partial [Bacteroidetes bacterium]|nr:Holliday junction resolvase RuvX [Bacteroidota bacterium]
MIAGGLTTVHSSDILHFLEKYIANEPVDMIVVGYPRQMNNRPSQATVYIDPFITRLKKKYPEIRVETEDERFTSEIAVQAMVAGGIKKEKRRDKATIDRISATIILQSYLERRNIINQKKR